MEISSSISNSEMLFIMKCFIKSFLFIILTLFVLDRAGGKLMWIVNQHSKDVSAPKLKYLASMAHEEMVLLGASRCSYHYVPSILQDSTGMTVYNGGIDASNNIFAHYISLNLLLSHTTPKVIVLEVMSTDYNIQDSPFRTISFFAPYINKEKHIDSTFHDAGTYWHYQISHLYRYNAKAVSNIGGLVVNTQTKENHGYSPLSCSKVIARQPQHVHTPQGVDTMKLQYLEKFIHECKARNIYLVFSVSPAYSIPDENLYQPIKDLAMKKSIPFLDYHTRGLYLDKPEYFKDEKHLCGQGAEEFSAIFAHDLKGILQKSYPSALGQ